MRTVLLAAVLHMLTALPIAFAADARRGDPARGEQIYGRCLASHAIDRDRTGRDMHGLIGRSVGSAPGSNHSPALRKAGPAGRCGTGRRSTNSSRTRRVSSRAPAWVVPASRNCRSAPI